MVNHQALPSRGRTSGSATPSPRALRAPFSEPSAIFYKLTPGSVLDLSEADWDRIMNVNIKGVWLCCKAVLPQMIKQGDEELEPQEAGGMDTAC